MEAETKQLRESLERLKAPQSDESVPAQNRRRSLLAGRCGTATSREGGAGEVDSGTEQEGVGQLASEARDNMSGQSAATDRGHRLLCGLVQRMGQLRERETNRLTRRYSLSEKWRAPSRT